jgi:HKD family nuclease
MKDWCIKARVTVKSQLRMTTTGKYLLKIELLDGEGSQIEAAFFGGAAEKFDKIIAQGKVYKFSNGQCKTVNLRFSNIEKATHEIVFERYSEISELPEDGTIMIRAFDFQQIKDLEY